jgi:uncharacterized RDD family membrane protein YckC
VKNRDKGVRSLEDEDQIIVRPAGLWIRILANFLDSLVVGVPLDIFDKLIGSSEHSVLVNIIVVIYSLVVPIYWSGYTIGMRIVGIRIVKVDGSKLNFGTMVLRTVVASIYYAVTLGILLIVSAFMVGLRKDKRAIHDLIAKTYVTYEKPLTR